jgi:hypothetical protein
VEPAERDLLQRNLALAEENNKLLHSMRRSQRWHSIMRVVWWLVIFCASAAFYYYYLWPYMQQILHVYQNVQQGGQQAQDAIVKFQAMFPWFFPQTTTTPH